MTSADVRIFPNLEELSREVAREFESLAERATTAGRHFCAALSGGSTPRPLYEMLGGAGFRIPWSSVELFQVDERCVPPGDPQSNFRMLREALLDRAPVPNFHRMRAEDRDLDRAARDYATELERALGPQPGERPRLDFVLLGMGPDGHTASLFPGSPALGEELRWVCPNYVEKLKMYRLTLTFPVINAAERVVFLVAGSDKAESLREVLEDSETQLPAARVHPASGRLTWYVEQSAAELL